MTYAQADRLVRGRLGDKRYRHSINVAQAAAALARKQGICEEKARLAGILHDLCKEEQKQMQLQLAQKSDIIFPGGFLESPRIWHAYAGANYIENELGLDDREIIDAVRYHSTGRGGMGTLEQIIYLADWISAERVFPEAAVIREKTGISLAAGMHEALKCSLWSLAEKGRTICIDTVEAYNFSLFLLQKEGIEDNDGT